MTRNLAASAAETWERILVVIDGGDGSTLSGHVTPESSHAGERLMPAGETCLVRLARRSTDLKVGERSFLFCFGALQSMQTSYAKISCT